MEASVLLLYPEVALSLLAMNGRSRADGQLVKAEIYHSESPSYDDGYAAAMLDSQRAVNRK